MFSSAAEVSKQKPRAVLKKRGKANLSFSFIVSTCHLIFWNNKLKSLPTELAPLKAKPAVKGKRTLISTYCNI